MSYEYIVYERKGRIAYIMLNQPDTLNASTEEMQAEKSAAFQEFDQDDEAWVAIYYGAGRCFSVGANVKKRQADRNREERARYMTKAHPNEGLLGLGRTANWKPVIAAVHGYCLGGAWENILECDLIVAAEDAKFAFSEVKRGLAAGDIWAQLHTFMPSKVGVEMALTGDLYPASELYRLGLINRLVPVGQHLQAAEEMAEKLLKAPPLAVRAGVRVARWSWFTKAAEASMYSQALRLALTEDSQESARAFVEKRAPVYHAR